MSVETTEGTGSGAGVTENLGAGGDGGSTTSSTESQTAASGNEAQNSGGKDSSKKGFENLIGRTPAPETKPVVTAPPAYQPNFKFKVLDKEHEIEEWARAAIKDADTEKKARELFEKAYGLDTVKADRQTLKSENQELKSYRSETEAQLQELGNYRAKKDWDSFFAMLEVSPDDVLRYAIDLAKREQWTPEQKAQFEQGRNAQVQAREAQKEVSQSQARQQDLEIRMRNFEIDQHVASTPEVLKIAQAYDAGTGNSGAFKQFVVQIGAGMALGSKKDFTVAEVVQEAVRHLRAANPSLGAETKAPAVTPPTTQVVQPHTKPTIPSIKGTGSAPVKSQINSFADLAKRRKELEAASA